MSQYFQQYKDFLEKFRHTIEKVKNESDSNAEDNPRLAYVEIIIERLYDQISRINEIEDFLKKIDCTMTSRNDTDMRES